MRTGLVFLLAVMLSLNTAYAAVVGICDALEHTSNHAAHFGHHSHEHSADHIHDDSPDNFDGASNVPSISDHHHAHPSFSSIPPGIIGVMPLTGRSPMVAAPADAFITAPQTPPARPPRAVLA